MSKNLKLLPSATDNTYSAICSSVLIDTGEFPLYLPIPDGMNNGGYSTPLGPAYSPVDLLVAGLEAITLKEEVDNLCSFFDTHRRMLSEHEVKLCIRLGSAAPRMIAVAELKCLISRGNLDSFLTVLRRNAPLTFKWGF